MPWILSVAVLALTLVAGGGENAQPPASVRVLVLEADTGAPIQDAALLLRR